MSAQRYAAYKESHVDWLGIVPEHWHTVPLWTHFRRTKRVGFASEELLSVYRDHGVVPKTSRDDNFNKPSEDLSTYQLVEPGDLVINKMKAWQGSVAISEHRGIVSPAYFVYQPSHAANRRYLHYLMRSAQYTSGYLVLSKGIRINQWDLQPEEHSRMPLLLPPIGEQRLISEFLDDEMVKFEALMTGQRQLIALLQEKRQAAIAYAVTRGLESTATMNPSEIDWLGDVPAHWTFPPLSARYDAQLGKMLDEKQMTGAHPVPYLRNADVNWDTINAEDLPTIDVAPYAVERYCVRPGDVLICEGGAGVGQTAIWTGSTDCVAYQKALHRLRARTDAENPRFVYYCMRFIVHLGLAPVFGNVSTIPHLTGEKLRALRLPCPPRHEQDAIVAYLDSVGARADELIQQAERAIALLQERRAALISAAVTGQINVRSRDLTEALAA